MKMLGRRAASRAGRGSRSTIRQSLAEMRAVLVEIRPVAGDRRQHDLFKGVDHVGVGVADMEAAKAFYGRVGFSDVHFDYTGVCQGRTARLAS